MAPEEFFMYLTVALIVVIPISVRVHRYLTRDRTARRLREQFQRQSTEGQQQDDRQA